MILLHDLQGHCSGARSGVLSPFLPVEHIRPIHLSLSGLHFPQLHPLELMQTFDPLWSIHHSTSLRTGSSPSVAKSSVPAALVWRWIVLQRQVLKLGLHSNGTERWVGLGGIPLGHGVSTF